MVALVPAPDFSRRATGPDPKKTARSLSEPDMPNINMQDLIELARDTIFIHDLSNKILFWNRSAEQNYDHTTREAIGRTALQLLQTTFPTSFNAVQRQLTALVY